MTTCSTASCPTNRSTAAPTRSRRRSSRTRSWTAPRTARGWPGRCSTSLAPWGVESVRCPHGTHDRHPAGEELRGCEAAPCRRARRGRSPGARPGDVQRRARHPAARARARRNRSGDRRPSRRGRRSRKGRDRPPRQRSGRPVRGRADRGRPRARDRIRSACCSCRATRRCSSPRGGGPPRWRRRSRDRGRSARHRHERARALSAGCDRAVVRPGSFAATWRRPRRDSFPTAPRTCPLALDVDTPADLAQLAAALETRRGQAPSHTRARSASSSAPGPGPAPGAGPRLTALSVSSLAPLPPIRPGDDLAGLIAAPRPRTCVTATCW